MCCPTGAGASGLEEIVIVSGNLDSWDLAQGAIDDGAGVASAMGAVHVLQSLGLHARADYPFRRLDERRERKFARPGLRQIERARDGASDRRHRKRQWRRQTLLGVSARMCRLKVVAHARALEPRRSALSPLGAGILDRRGGAGGSDVQYLDAGGVPTLAPIVDTRTYFDYHHSAADTLDKVEPENIRRQVALLAMMAYFVAEMPEALPRLPPSKPSE